MISFLRRSALVIMMLILAVVAAGCSQGGGAGVETAEPTATTSGDSSSDATVETARVPCEDGRLLIGDLPGADGEWAESISIADELALGWETDAQLVEFRLTCALFGPGFRVQATYYSPNAQALFASDTNESQPITVEEDETVTPLDMSVVSFASIRDALNGADFTDDLELEPSTGVDIRVNMVGLPFGPSEAPFGSTIAHVSVVRLGEINDLYVDVDSSQIYRYASPAG